MEIIELPQVLTSLIGSESSDFAVKAGLRRPVSKSFGNIGFGLLFTIVTGIFVLIFLGADRNSETGTIGTGSDTPVVALLSVFMLIAITILVSGIIKACRTGGYFVGTPKRLINYRNGKHYSIDWQKFAGDTQVTGNSRKGTITLVMRPENLSNGETVAAYVPNVVYITSVKDPMEIERMIRKRIKENDPTPAVR
ncbi:MAG TPA: hypothetical protein VK207_10260 [Bacteroidales bacterium]|nr:hypothetical protein [Bacteroidales bacterium]